MINSRRVRLAKHVTRMEEKRDAYMYSIGGKARDQDVGGWIILKFIIERQDAVV
jgi:hypothetical protein